ncbi:hypothetical protein V1478_010299 [Vespula squamosa]|uniref:Uncharacterized protein n=1 Tax=Vespula squamosa TaxID=30214 RepID=A0ABD2AHD7_VESSQ
MTKSNVLDGTIRLGNKILLIQLRDMIGYAALKRMLLKITIVKNLIESWIYLANQSCSLIFHAKSNFEVTINAVLDNLDF